MNIDGFTILEFLKRLNYNPRVEEKRNDLGEVVPTGIAFVMSDGNVEWALELIPEEDKDDFIELYNDVNDDFFEDFIEPILISAYGLNMDETFLPDLNNSIQVAIEKVKALDGSIENYIAHDMLMRETNDE
jgi:hypothetical protein